MVKLSTARLMTLCVVAGAAITADSRANVTVTGDGFYLSATNGAGTSQYFVPYNAFTFEVFAGLPSWKYADTGTVALSNGSKLSNFNIRYVGDPEIHLNFTVQAGATDTTFLVQSGLMSFPTIAGVSGFATNGVTLTDTGSGGGNGATYTGLEGGGKGYRTNYNGAIPGGSIFALANGTFSNFGTTTAQSDRFPASGNAPVAGTVSNMQAEWYFSVTADDSSGITSRYKLTPTPGTMFAMLGGLLGMSRRRR